MSQLCLVCDKTAPVHTRAHTNIFSDNTSHGNKLAETLSEILEKPITEGGVHTNVLCRKCQKAVSEYSSSKLRLETIKTGLISEFKNTLPNHDLDYETYNQKTPKTPAKIPGNTKSPTKKVVLPASKLHPLPPDYVINVNNLISGFNFDPKVVLSKMTSITSNEMGSNTLNQKASISSSILTPTVKTSSPNTTASQYVPTTESSPMKSTTKPSQITDTVTEVNINELLSNKSDLMMSFSVNMLPKNFMSSSVMKENEVKRESDASNAEPMDIDNDCTLLNITNETGKSDNEAGEKDTSKDNTRREYVLDINDVTLQPWAGAHDEDDDDSANDDDYQHTIVMSSGDASILRVMSGQKLVYEGGEVSLVMPGADDDDASDHDSNDAESQIELQMSGDEETANAIIAAARDQGGAFIKVESGEMYRLKSVVSEIQDDEEENGAELGENVKPAVVWEGNKFKCMLCDLQDGDTLAVSSGDATFITKHMRAAHNAPVYACAACHVVFTEYKQYCDHVDKHERETEKSTKNKMHECSACDKKYSSISQLREHQNTHTGAKPHVCSVCKKAFASKYTHQAHMKTHAERPRPFKCSRCSKAFLTQQNLQQHERTHLGVKSFFCKVCGKAFGTQHNLDVHGVVHSGDRPFACADCGKAFARRAELRDHTRTHTGERPFKCDLCEASFAQRSNLHSHKRATHFDDKRYQCNDCPKKFKRRRLLEYHIKASHTGERPLECEVCHATFVYPEHYKKHLRIHSGERPFVCEVCGKAFNSRDNRNTHRFVHSDKKPYECLVCGAGYMRKQLLYAHMNTTGHLAESIVVNQPRVQKIKPSKAKQSRAALDAVKSTDKLDMLLQNSEQMQLETSDGKAVTGSIEITTDADGKIYLTGTGDKKLLLEDAKESLNFVQDLDDAALLSLQNTEGSIKTDTGLQEISLDQLVDQSQMGGEGDMLRLVQVQLPGGASGWLALNH